MEEYLKSKLPEQSSLQVEFQELGASDSYQTISTSMLNRQELVYNSKSSWIYKWMWDLNDIKLVNDYAVQSSQAKLRRHLPNDMEWYLRRRLGYLQTKTPAWTLLDFISQSAQELSRELKKEQPKNDIKPETTRGDSDLDKRSQTTIGDSDFGESNDIKSRMSSSDSDLGKSKDKGSQKISDDLDRDERKEKESQTSGTNSLREEINLRKRKSSALTKFVKLHVFWMLEMLYAQIIEEQIKLVQNTKKLKPFEKCAALIYADPTPIYIKTTTQGDDQTTHTPTQDNLQTIHTLTQDNLQTTDTSTQGDIQKIWRYELKQDAKVTLLGPVGERPLHLCSLRAAEFQAAELQSTEADRKKLEKDGEKFVSKGVLDEEVQSSKADREKFVSKGILGAMKRFIQEHNLKNDELKDELRCQYGKDYCAAVCNFLHVRARSYQQVAPPGSWKAFASELTDKDNPLKEAPYWRELCNWASKKAWELKDFQDSSDPEYQSKEIDHSKHLQYVKLTRGLYEGETIMFPRIAVGDDDTVKFLLKHDAQVVESKDKFINIRATGLFFRPKYPHYLSPASLVQSYGDYIGGRLRESNEHASSPNTYFGTRPLDFALSQGKDELFTQLLDFTVQEFVIMDEKERKVVGKVDEEERRKQGKLVLQAILDSKDEIGNTLLHLAAWNGQKDMFDYLVKLGADRTIVNSDGMTPFVLTARFGLWDMFDHIWDKHLSKKIWVFGKTEAIKVDISDFDWHRIGTFSNVHEIEICIHMLLTTWQKLHVKFSKPRIGTGSDEDPGRFKEILKTLELEEERFEEKEDSSRYRQQYQSSSGFNPPKQPKTSATDKTILGKSTKPFPSQTWSEHLTAVRIITLYRPPGWYKAAASHVEEVLMKKWQRCYQFVYLGNTLIPYCILVLLFGLMWEKRQIHVLDHRFWWAQGSVWAPRPDPTVEAPAEFGTIFGRLTHLGGPESACGWTSMKSSQSGRLQMALFIYGVPSLIQLAYAQRRIRPSDLDLDGSMTISVPEIVNFIYFNLESLFHLILAGLFTTMFASRVGAGIECDTDWLRAEKNVTSIAALVIFCNLFIVLKPIKNIGLFILAMYRFLATDVLSFLIMYSMFFAAFLIALQTLHNANVYYLTWFENNLDVWPEIKTATNGMAYMNGQNSPPGPDDPITLLSADVMMSGCSAQVHTIYDTAFALLSISLGDGFGDAIQQARSSKFDCAGFRPDLLIAYILVLWVFLTNVLQLNMLLAMMNWTFESQKDREKEIWLLDVSYRILRYEHSFPELTNHAHKWKPVYGIFTFSFLHTALADLFLTIYCMPEIQLIMIIVGNITTTAWRVPDATKQNLVQRLLSANSKRVWSRVLFMWLNSSFLPWLLRSFSCIFPCFSSSHGNLHWEQSAHSRDSPNDSTAQLETTEPQSLSHMKPPSRRLSTYLRFLNINPVQMTSETASARTTWATARLDGADEIQTMEVKVEIGQHKRDTVKEGHDKNPQESGERDETSNKKELENRLWCFLQHPLLIGEIEAYIDNERPKGLSILEIEAQEADEEDWVAYVTTAVFAHQLLIFRNLYNETRSFNRIEEK